MNLSKTIFDYSELFLLFGLNFNKPGDLLNINSDVPINYIDSA